MIVASSLYKSFEDNRRGTVCAVDGISLNCESGQIYGLLGPNGAGKTTLMRMLATILSPTSGSGSVAGYDIVRQAADVRAHIGYMSSLTALYERLTPREMVRYFGELNRIGQAELAKRTKAIFERLEIEQVADSRCDKLSTGQKQRVSIARTIIHAPPVLIFDEPTNGLDILASRTIIRFIKECRDEGRTVLFSTHILSEIEELCDKIGIVHEGRLVAEGSQSELAARYGKPNLRGIFLSALGAE